MRPFVIVIFNHYDIDFNALKSRVSLPYISVTEKRPSGRRGCKAEAAETSV